MKPKLLIVLTVLPVLSGYSFAPESRAGNAASTQQTTARNTPGLPFGDLELVEGPPGSKPRLRAMVGFEGLNMRLKQVPDATAILEFTVTVSGDVAEVVVVSANDEVFSKRAVQYATRMKFHPVVTGRQKVACRFRMPFGRH